MAFMNLIEFLKEEMNKSHKEILGREYREVNKRVQDLKVEIESIKKTQTERNVEMKNLGT